MHVPTGLCELFFRVKGAFTRASMEAELSEEMRFHRELLTRDLERLGVAPEEAASMVARRFGNVTALREQSRDWWGIPGLEALGRDVRHAARRLRRAPSFTAVVIATFALGVGANIAIFSLVDAALLRQPPYPEPGRLVVVNHSYRSPQLTAESQVSPPGFRDYTKRARSFAATAAIQPWDVNLRSTGSAERIRVVKATNAYLRVLGSEPRLGRGFTTGDDEPGHRHVVVLSDALWRSSFGAAPDIVGRTVELDGQSYEVIGVMAASFEDAIYKDARAWTPLALTSADLDPAHYTDENLDFVARLAPGVGVARASDELSRIADDLRQEYPDRLGKDWSLSVTGLHERTAARAKSALLVMLGAVALVLVIACANIASLLLARVGTQRREVAVRAALGGGRAVIVRELLVENFLLALAGGIIGIGLAAVAVRVLPAYAPADVFRTDHVEIGQRVIAFAVMLVGITTIVCGIVPALRASRADVTTELAATGRTGSGDRRTQSFRGLLVITEIALAVVLVTGATLVVQSVSRLASIDPGFDPHGLLTFKLSLPTAKYTSVEARTQFFDEVLERSSHVPGVTGIAASNALPFAGNFWTTNFVIEGRTSRSMADMPWGDRRVVNAGYFAAMRVPLRAGRAFTPNDRGGGDRVVIVDDLFGRRYFGSESPVGRRIAFGRIAGDTAHQWSTIVGVVQHAAHEGLDATPRVQVYQPYAQANVNLVGLELAVRTSAGASVLAEIRGAVRSIDPGVAVADVRSMDDRVARSFGQRTLTMFLLAAFSVLALALAGVGVYGTMSHAVAMRTRELGIRRALGASGRGVIALVLRRAVALAAVGVGIGVYGASELSRLLASQLYGVRPGDLLSLTFAAASLTAVATLAALAPAIRATHVDPLIALRSD